MNYLKEIGYKNPRLYLKYNKKVTGDLEKRLSQLEIETIFDPNAVSILKKRYLSKDENGVPQENLKQLFGRVAANIAYADYYYTKNKTKTYETARGFYEMMLNKEFMPNSPTLMNAGRAMQQLAACFVLPIEDTMESIFWQVFNTAMIHKSGGGTGFSFSNLRRKNDYVTTTYGKASGPVSFIETYDTATHSVNQGGFRRGANMGILRIDHPDILEFIHAKENEKDKRYVNFNFSVAVTDDFMKAVERGDYYILKNPRKGKLYDLTIEDIKRDEESVRQNLIKGNERVLVVDKAGNVIYQNPIERNVKGEIERIDKKRVGKVIKSDDTNKPDKIALDARTVFDEIARLAHKNGEPGILFIDEVNRHNPTRLLGEIEATNPCGEQPLLSYEACNLGSINLGLMVDDGKIDYTKLEKTVKKAVHFLDNVIDMSNYPLEEIINMVHLNRKIGLGVMGFADMLTKLSISYNSDVAVETAKEVMKFIQEKATEKSQELAEQRGAFPSFDKSIYAKEKPRRNATITTIAPTGTISIIAGASSGIEPLFDLCYIHEDADKQERIFKNKNLENDLKKAGIDPNEVFEELSRSDGKTLNDLDFVPKKIKEAYTISKYIPIEKHVEMQAAFQENTHNAVSKTINAPNSATVEDVKKAYLLAYKLGCKGITVYREGSREEEVLRAMKRKKNLARITLDEEGYIIPRKRPVDVRGSTTKRDTGCGNLFITLNKDEEGKLLESFISMGKGGGCAASQNEALGRLISLALRSGINPKSIIGQLLGIGCGRTYPSYPAPEGKKSYSCADAISKAIADRLEMNIIYDNTAKFDSENFEPVPVKSKEEDTDNKPQLWGACPMCGSGRLRYSEGCHGGICISCGYSECS